MLDTHETALVEMASNANFALTLDRLIQGIEAAGMIVFAQIDHAAGARDIGTEIPPTTVLVYGHARGGIPIILATPQAGLDLPLRLLVRETDDGQTLVSFRPIAAVLRQVGVPETLATRLDSAQELIVRMIP